MRNSLKILIPSVCALLQMSTVTAARASDLNDGIKAYSAKDYATALPLFVSANKVAPADPVALYYLANTYLAVGQMVKAKYSYQLCAHYAKDAATQNQCKAALQLIEKNVVSVEPKTSQARPSGTAAPAAAESDEEKLKREQLAEQNTPAAKQKQIVKQILKDARAECDKIRWEVEERIKNEPAYDNVIVVRGPSTRAVRSTSKERDDEYRREAEEKCAQVMNIAEARCRGYR